MTRALDSEVTAPLATRLSRGVRSHATYGEDLVLRQIFEHAPPGVYVEVGAFHPVDGSLTHRLHRAGWSGFNIDASAASIDAMRRARPDDRHLVAAIGAPSTDAVFVEFETGSLSSADPGVTDQWIAAGNAVVRRSTVRLRGLADVFAELGVPSRFEYLNIDIEGLDLAALQSNDWESFRPEVISVEDPLAALGGPESTPIGAYLTDLGYSRIAAMPPTSIFVEPEIVDRLLRWSGADPERFFARRQAGE